MNESNREFRLDHYISSKGLNCRMCGNPIDTKTTITMLCTQCKRKEWSKKQREAFKRKYGIDNPMRVPEYIDKIKQTMQERYGVNNAMNVPQFRKKNQQTCIERYGSPFYVTSKEYADKVETSSKSKINKAFGQLLSENGIQYSIEECKNNKRFDFSIVGQKILIEIDPTYTHTVAGNHWDKDGLPRDQQLVKTAVAEKYGYRCIHVFDWDDWNDIIDLIKPRQVKIFARNCDVKVVEDDSCDEFINTNHIQKNCKGTRIAIGLYYNDELIQVMTFGKPRYNNNYEWELLRLCSKKDINVVGGASKLFSYATKKLNLTSIISYCDRSKFTGSVYTNMGMKLLRLTEPQEIWSKGNEKITSSLLRQRGFDQLFNTNFGKGTPNEQLMIANGWLPVYDCGQMVFVYGEPKNKEQLNQDENNEFNYAQILNSMTKKRTEKMCAFCGEPFIPNSGQQLYCKRPHYMDCPVCGKKYLVTNNENLKRPPVACSYECRKVRREQTSMEKYGIKTPGNNPEARAKSKQTMQEKYGVDCSFKSEELREKGKETLLNKYGVDNIQKLKTSSEQAVQTRQDNWTSKIHRYFPFDSNKIIPQQEIGSEKIDETKMDLYVLKEKLSFEFLSKYGFKVNFKPGKIHLSLGLIFDRTIYQVIRFERCDGNIVLSNFGTRSGFYNPDGYAKLMDFAINVKGIDSFTAQLPRNAITDEIKNSLSIQKIHDGEYKVYWIQSDRSFKEVTRWDNIEEMIQTNDYAITDYIDTYEYVPKQRINSDSLIEFSIHDSHQFNA